MKNKIEVIGEVIDLVRDVIRVQVEGKIILASPSGKIRINGIQIVPHDRVKVEVSSADLTRGRVIQRL
jgi:translation initiation factor IF-1